MPVSAQPKIFQVPEQAAGRRVDAWLAEQPGAGSRAQIKVAAEAGGLSIDGAPCRVSRRLRGGETVAVAAPIPVPAAEDTRAEAIEVDVLYEDEFVVAVNKPAGMVVHPAVGNRSGTLVNALLHRFADAALPGSPDRAGIVHRLDRDTSGVILIARTVTAHAHLSAQFRNRSIEKTYLAVVRADVRSGATIDLPIGRHRTDRKKMSTVASRTRTAETTLEPLERFGSATLLQVRPKTGRTHQIRVHLAASGWPIIGDPVYGSTRAKATTGLDAEIRKAMPRQALHAAEIGFNHPHSEERIRIKAALPRDFADLLEVLRSQV